MKAELTTFRVFPAVVPANKESELFITSCGGYMLFYDDITYEVQLIPADESDTGEDESLTLYGLDKERKIFYIKPENGVLKIRYFFSGEQQWNIKISTHEYAIHERPVLEEATPFFDWVRVRPENGVIVSVYSLEEDLYVRRALRGDLHVHTNYTDGDESPSLTAAMYRRAGYDFIAITDHGQYNVGEVARKKFDFKTDYNIMTAEEIHNRYDGQLHVICIGAKKGISEILMKHGEQVEAEVEEMRKTTRVPEGVPEKEYLYRLWVYNKAKNEGGFVIYPHPYWNIKKCRWHVGPKLAMAILENGLCDAFEIMGGGNAEENNLQTALYYEAVSRGVKMPVVGSTDNHSVLCAFDRASTYVFTENGDVTSAIEEGYSVAAEHWPGDVTRFYGPYRLVRYARFLADHYFPLHTELCASSGKVITDYVQGDLSLKLLIEALEKRITDFENKFFGRFEEDRSE